MCEYVKENLCTIIQAPCPYVYFCNKVNDWRPNKAMPKNCKIKLQQETPKGYYRVRQERKGYLYVEVGDITIKALNPFDYVPTFVKVTKLKNGEYRIKK